MTDVTTATETASDEAIDAEPDDDAVDTDERSADTASADSPFIHPVAMEDDPDELFPGDRGVLDPDARRVLVRLLQRRFLLAERSRGDWAVLLEHQSQIESRLGDLFIRLVVDHDRGVAYKQQVRSDELEVPILLKDEAYTRAETLVLVHLRTVYQREITAGEGSARVDVEEVEQTVLSYYSAGDRGTARRQRDIRNALNRLRVDGVVEEESEGRYRISALVEILLSSERLHELLEWLRERTVSGDDADAGEHDGTDAAGDDADPADTDIPTTDLAIDEEPAR
ncbi:hypothetical protein GCM10027515_07040 [Schumannella luteola]|uniref:DUF4194 domain-containing protein n=1 Tax=Schumannella luteola TaxID=472059 RepID=A0A852YLT1_9MICO|nr:hypothetical protein [Schumannella luteola]TPX01881.1 DUF4194 domain-containing protein [Schumannella luteola]